jgi:hypothetical protein
MTVKNNQTIIQSETENNGGTSLRSLPIVLMSAIQSYGDLRRFESAMPEIYDVFEELSDLTGLAESTLRSYTNRHVPVYPTLSTLLLICKTISDRKPFDAFVKLGSFILGENVVNK